jgi:hypothetical protein
MLAFIAGPEGLRVRASSDDIAVEYHGPGQGPAETVWLPMALLADCEGRGDEPVEIERVGEGRVTAQCRDRGIPQLLQYDSNPPDDADKFPVIPDKLAENPSKLLKALADAAATTDPGSVRYALASIQLRPNGSLAATDGRQLLVQSGFTFP